MHPHVAATGFRQGLLEGFWVRALALIMTTAGLLIGGFSNASITSAVRRPVELSAGHERSRRAIRVCWGALGLFIVTKFFGLKFFRTCREAHFGSVACCCIGVKRTTHL